MCSNSATFELKEAETSNSLLLINNLKQGPIIETSGERILKTQEVEIGHNILTLLTHTLLIDLYSQVHGVYHTYYEMKPMKPKLQSLRNALARFPYKGKNSELNEEPIGVTFTELKETIMASEDEIFTELHKLPAVKIRNRWRLLHVSFLFGWVSYLDSILREKNVSLEDVSAAEVEDWMAMYDESSVNAKCISLYIEGDEDNLKWKSAAVSQLFALYLLPDLRAFDSKDFFNVWQASVPVGVQVILV